MNIRPFSPSTHSYAELTELLHRAYAPLWELHGLKFLAARQSEEVTRGRVEHGMCFVIEENGALTATITVYPEHTHSHCEYYRRPGVWVFGQFAVEPALQRRGIGAAMLAHVERVAIEHGGTELACDTAENATGLIAYYGRLGFLPVASTQWDETNYRSVILSKKLSG